MGISPAQDMALEPFHDESAVYSSQNMIARRQRMLEHARALIQETGYEKFSMSEVARRADVAKRTLYNAFKTKERLIATAIEDMTQIRVAQTPSTMVPYSLSWAIEQFNSGLVRSRALKDYVGAVIAIYFAPNPDTHVWQVIHEASASGHRPWINYLVQHKALRPGIDAQHLIDDLTGMKYSIAQNWCCGRISHEDAVLRQNLLFLSIMASNVVDHLQAPLMAALDSITRSGLADYLRRHKEDGPFLEMHPQDKA